MIPHGRTIINTSMNKAVCGEVCIVRQASRCALRKSRFVYEKPKGKSGFSL